MAVLSTGLCGLNFSIKCVDVSEDFFLIRLTQYRCLYTILGGNLHLKRSRVLLKCSAFESATYTEVYGGRKTEQRSLGPS